MFLIVAVFGGAACLIVDNLSALVPISILSVMVGIVGSVLACLGIIGVKSNEPPDRTSGL